MTRAGIRTIGFDVSPDKVNDLNQGRSHIDDLSDDELREMLDRGYSATTDANEIANADTVVICVPTPLNDSGGPDLGAVEAATRTITANMSADTLVILESTTYPGTTDDVVRPILESQGALHGKDFLLAFSPERVDPGSLTHGITNTPKLVGGIDAEATQRATNFYEQFIDTVVPLSGAKEAETAKLLENTYRHVNIALVNEMARFCHDLGIDIWEVIRGAATKPFGFQKFTPGPGVGGHCIPIDPNYLSFQVKKTLGYQFRFVELAQEINNSMPQYVVTRMADLLNDQGKAMNGSSVLLLGVTYKPDIADQRESPAVPLAKILQEKKATLRFHDPLVEEWNLGGESLTRVPDLHDAIEQADLVVLMQAHQSYDVSDLALRSTLFFDTRGVSAASDSGYRL